MLAANIETEVKEILERKGKNGWLRASECAKEYGKGNASRETKFYRWRKKVEKGKVEGFQVLKLPGNISFIGMDSADPRVIESFMLEDKRALRSAGSGFGFFEWIERRAERKRLENEKEERERAAEFRTMAEWLASRPKWGSMWKGLKDIAEIERKVRKDLGLEE